MEFHLDGTLPTKGEIFVFGANLRGAHGKGAAKVAHEQFGCPYGHYFGLTGKSYAIPTKDARIETLELTEIKSFVQQFVEFAKRRPKLKFFVTRIGCGLAGYEDEEIARLFKGATSNCSFAFEWAPYICEHDWEKQDDSFDHEFGTEVIVYERCTHCGATQDHEPYYGED